ncbi:hypothetical protein Scep_015508 [Stephania cephalantha]|uniref:Secreted protein n=1 Tax=Stephania cephalantha TaxID=152367 RepID=A0AAP0J5H2_9MAGN
MKIAAALLVLVLVNSCVKMQGKALVDEVTNNGQHEFVDESGHSADGVSHDISGADPNGHHYIPIDRYPAPKPESDQIMALGYLPARPEP